MSDEEINEGGEAAADISTDPVCGMDVEQAAASATSNYQGSRYFFCSQDCKEEFDENPSQYVE